ncbi:hypothetical protein ACPXCP_31280 [Streptomyces sp. DT20]|uniref:hypothetical protein n=1 Tax=Streptomyces sp. DT20 TaxID=3416519 RepID=UPI003CE7709D
MSTVLTISLPRDDVIANLGAECWPIRDGSPLLHIDSRAEDYTPDGAVIIYPTLGQPGYLWWLIDGVVPPQAAGDITAELAEQIPGSVLELPPPPDENPAPPADQ